MSIQWTFIAGYLYVEIGIVIIMMLPIASPRRWNQFFKSRLFSLFQQHAAIYFYVLLGVLGMFLMDAVREMKKYSHSTDISHVNLASEMKGSVKLFRAQRNFYITGFAIFLAFVIRRLVTMIIIQAELLEKSERIIKEAEAAKDLAKTTILAHTMEAEEVRSHEDWKKQLEIMKDLLKEEENRTKALKQESTNWRLKYEEIVHKHSGKGDVVN